MKYFQTLLIVCVFAVVLTNNTTAINQPTAAEFTIHQTEPEKTFEAAMLFAHGIAATKNQVLHHYARHTNRNIDGSYTSNKHWLFDQPICSFNFPDSLPKSQFNKTFVNLGQKLDMERLDEAFHATLEQVPGCKKIIGSGISRGAVTWLNYAAEKRPEELGALILESPFETIKSIIHNLLRRFHLSWVPFSTSLIFWAAKKKFTSLNMNGPFPIDLVDQIDKNLPILMVHSRSDQVIPTNSSRKLYVKLLQSGHNNIYLLELARGDHGKLMQGMEAEIYQNCVHAFLQKYNLPHCDEFAQRGRSLLATCQPSIQEVQKWIKQKRSIAIDDEPEDVTPLAA